MSVRAEIELALDKHCRRSPEGSAQRLLAQYDADRRAEALTEGANAINALPQDYECDPGRGDAADLLRRMAGEKSSREADATPDFFQPGRTYQRRRWEFQCLAVAPAPHDGQVRAVGYLGRPNETATVHGMTRENWEHDGWTDVTEGGDH
jgi:hypothetical protein